MKRTVTIPNIRCAACVRTVTNELKAIEGVKAVDGVADTKTVTVEYDEPATWEQIVAALTEIDFPPA